MPDIATVKSNISKMIAQQAPESDIDGYITAAGYTVDDIRNFKLEPEPEKQSMLGEIVRPGLKAAKGIVAGTLGGAADLAQAAVNLPYYAGFKGAQAVNKLATGKESDAEFKPLFGGVGTVSPAIREGFDKATGGLTANRNKGEELLEIPEEILAGAAGPTAMSKVGQAVAPLSKKLIQKVAGINPREAQETLRAFEKSGVDPRLADIAQGQTTKTFQNLLGNFPGSRGVIEKATQQQVDDITKQLANITNNEGGSIQQTGKIIQDGAKNVEQTLKNRTDKLYSNLDKFIPREEKLMPSTLISLAQKPEIQDVVAVGEGQTGKILSHLNALLDADNGISYDRLRIFRSTIGKKLQNPTLGGDERGAIKQIYGALSEDLKNAIVAKGGKEGLEAFNKANNAFGRYTDALENKINPLIDAKTPEAVYSMAMSGSKQGGSNIRPIMKTLDQPQKEFVRGTVAQKMGAARAGEQDATGEVFSPAKFLTEWNKLSPEARTNIFTKEQVGSIDELNKVISKLKDTSKARQTSNNLPYAAWAGLGGLTASNPLAGIGAVGGAKLTAELMTSPKFIKWLAQAPKVSPSAMPKHIKLLSKIAATNSAVREDVLEYLHSITLGDEDQSQ